MLSAKRTQPQTRQISTRTKTNVRAIILFWLGKTQKTRKKQQNRKSLLGLLLSLLFSISLSVSFCLYASLYTQAQRATSSSPFRFFSYEIHVTYCFGEILIFLNFFLNILFEFVDEEEVEEDLSDRSSGWVKGLRCGAHSRGSLNGSFRVNF